MDTATLEETNRIRLSLGMKPLPVPGGSAQPAQAAQAASSDSDDEPASTIETRQAQAYDNYKKVRDADDARRKRDEKAATVKKARDAALRFAELKGVGLADSDLGGAANTKAWLTNQKKRQKKIEKARKLEEELAAAEAAAAAAVQYTSKDLAGVKVAHDMSTFLDGDAQILTLKDTTIDENEEEGDELENADLRDKEKLNEQLDLKKKKPVYDVHADGEQSILAQYDEEIYGKKTKNFTLDVDGAIAEFAESLDGPEQTSRRPRGVDLGILEDAPAASDYLDISEIKVKKPKKKKKTARQRPVDEDDIFPTEPLPEDDQLMEVDSVASSMPKKRKALDGSFVDDEDLQASLAIQRRAALKKRKKMRPEDIVKQVREQAAAEAEEPQDAGLVINDISEFVAGLRNPEDEEEKKVRKPKTPVAEQSVTAMGEESEEDEDHQMKDGGYDEDQVIRENSADADLDGIGVEDEKTVDKGMGATLQLLRERGLVKSSNGEELNMDFRNRAEFLAKKRRMEEESEEYARQQRERDRTSGRMDRMSERDRQEMARQQNERRDLAQSRHLAQLFQTEYRPNVELKYTDEFGRRLDRKEAFKHLSHQFHGKGSGKGKTDKRLKKIEDEKRRESQSMLDASQNMGMSSATAQQLKKRKEPGIRLA
jgi:U4/U6.U5 tri-snRNP-associated protein 1